MSANIQVVYTFDTVFLNTCKLVLAPKGRTNFDSAMATAAQVAFDAGRRFQAQHPTLEAPQELPETDSSDDEPVPS